MKQTSPLQFFKLLKWIDGRPLTSAIEPYRQKIFMDALQEQYHAPIVHQNQRPESFDDAMQHGGFEALHYQLDGPHRMFSSPGIQPWKLPDVASLPNIDPNFATDPTGFMPYARDAKLARPWAVPGTPDLRHRIGGLEKEDGTGNISYDSANHEHMTHLRAERVARVSVPDIEVDDPDGASLLVLGWGSSYGAIQGAARRLRREQGLRVATAHIKHLNPLPANTGEVLRSYKRVLVPEMNMGQLVKILRAEFLVDCESYTKVDGLPIFTRDMMEEIAPRC